MKLIQLNAWGGRLEPQIRNFLLEEKPDILCLQEAISFQAAGSGLFLPLEAIQAECGLANIAFGPVFSFKFMKQTAHFGNAILSSRPIKRSETIFTHKAHDPDFMWGERDSNMRNFVHAFIQVGENSCHVITHHGFWVPDHKDGNQETMRQVQQIVDYVKELSGPVILTGDFNLAPHSESLEHLNSILTNLSINHGLKTTRTHLTHKTEVCDYIFVNDVVRVKRFTASDQIVSDHRALVLEFSL